MPDTITEGRLLRLFVHNEHVAVYVSRKSESFSDFTSFAGVVTCCTPL